jgi:anaerobic magnesium-protoporphyrin IX monomethyl ester cyclase
MDIVLIRPGGMLGRSPVRSTTAPLGLLAIAAPVQAAGYSVKIIDQRTDKNWEAELLTVLATKPVCVGISVMTGPSIFWALKASEIVKGNSNVPVVWGGIHPTILPEQTIQNQNIDFLVCGEGEDTFLELVRALAGKSPVDLIKGIWYREAGQIKHNPPAEPVDLNMQPPLSYELIDIKSHMTWMSGKPGLQFETSRGCPFRCAFCYNTSFRPGQWRALTAARVVEGLKFLVQKYKIPAFVFSDDNFFVDIGRARDILRGIVKEKLNIVWGKGDIRLDLLSKLDDDFLKLLENSKCQSLVIGMESGSQKMANLLRKEIDVSQVFSVNRKMAAYPIELRYLFLVGVPGETRDDLRQTADMMLRLTKENPRASVAVQIFIPYPGTELYDLAVQAGLKPIHKLEDWIYSSWSNRSLDYPWMTKEMKQEVRMMSFCSYFIAVNNPKTFGRVSGIVRLAGFFYRPVARARLRKGFYKLAPELKLAELLGFRGQ